MPWDIIFYGAMAVIFIGIMVASAKSRMAKREAERTKSRDGKSK